MQTTTRILFFGCWGSAFVLTHVPDVPDPLGVEHSDKVYHFVAYGILAVLGWRAYPPPVPTRRLARLAMWLAVWAAYGAMDEGLQAFHFIGRSAEVGDWAADLTGAAIGLVVAQWYDRCAAPGS